MPYNLWYGIPRHVRPGGGFVPRATMFNKVSGGLDQGTRAWDPLPSLQVRVNGSGEHPVFAFLKAALPSTSDPKVLGHPEHTES